MNVRTLKQQQKIKRIDFGEHIIGYRFGPYPQDQRIYRPFQSTSHTFKRKDLFSSGKSTRNLLTSSGRRSTKQMRKLPGQSDQQDLLDKVVPEKDNDDVEQIKRQQEKHFEFIRSYQGWLNQAYVQSFKTAKMTQTLGFKRSKSSVKNLRSSEAKVYELKTGEYKQGNIFPCRKVNPVKKISRKPSKPELKQNTAHQKDQGQLKLKLIKSLVKTEVRPPSRKDLSKRNLANSQKRASSALLRTFSNPKILSIQNRQLVKGTKILIQ